MKCVRFSKLLAFFIALMLILGLSSCGKSETRLDWPTSELATMVPKMPAKYGKVIVDSENTLVVNGNKMSQTQYEAYIKECEQAGYIYDAETDTHSYSAFNEDGYKVTVRYYSQSEEIHLTVDTSLERQFTTISWPKSEIAGLVPIPNSLVGFISWEESDGFVLYIGETNRDEYHAYVDTCWDAGFNLDYHRSDDHFWADDTAGNKLTVDFEGNQTMRIRADAAEISSESSVQPSQAVSTPVSTEPQETPAPETVSEQNNPQPSETISENLTVENCQELADILQIRGELNDAYATFAKKYQGQNVEIDACVTYFDTNPRFQLRWDVMLEAGDYVDEDTRNLGPVFYFTNIQPYDLGWDSFYFPDFVRAGANVHIVAEILSYNDNTGHFELKPVSIVER